MGYALAPASKMMRSSSTLSESEISVELEEAEVCNVVRGVWDGIGRPVGKIIPVAIGRVKISGWRHARHLNVVDGDAA
jgi:hypothetical protein